MKTRVETLTPPNTPKPIGPYSHIAKVGQHITIGGTAGFDPAAAIQWATQRGSRSGRVAWQYVVELAGRSGLAL